MEDNKVEKAEIVDMKNISTLIQEGAVIEKEHKPTYDWLLGALEKGNIPSEGEFYEHIAADHIVKEGEKYYPYLDKMEKALKKA